MPHIDIVCKELNLVEKNLSLGNSLDILEKQYEMLKKGYDELDREYEILKNENKQLKKTLFNSNEKYRIRYDLPHPDYKNLYRIEALKDFKGVSRGSIGGYVESEKNLSSEGNCWIFDDAIACERSKVFEDACLEGKAIANKRVKIFGRARISGNALITNDSQIFDDAKIKDHTIINGAKVFENAIVANRASVYENSEISGNALLWGDCKIFGNAKINGNAEIDSRAKICGNSVITDNAIIDAEVLINRDAYIVSKSDFLFINGLGSSFTFFKTKDNNIKATMISDICLDYNGNLSLDEFEKLCFDEISGETFTYKKEYLSFIKLAKELLK